MTTFKTLTGKEIAEKVETYLLSRPELKFNPTTGRSVSPFHPGADNPNGVHWTFQPSTHRFGGMFKEFTGDRGGTLWAAAVELGLIDLNEYRAEAANTKRVYTGLAEYALAHGVTEDVFTKAGWSATTHKGRPALLFKVGGQNKYRYLDGEQPPYEWAGGSHAHWYGLRDAPRTAQQKNCPLVLVNGEASVVVAHHFGIPAATTSGGEGSLPDELLAELKTAWPTDRPILIAYDCDETGIAKSKLVRTKLTEAGYIDVGAVDLRLTNGGDVCDFCVANGQFAPDALFKLPRNLYVNETLNEVKKTVAEAKALTADPQAELLKQVNKSQSDLDRIRNAVSPIKVVTLADRIDELVKPVDSNGWWNCPLPHLTALVGGPLRPELYTFYGATGSGKSWWAASLVSMLTQTYGRGMVVTTEMDPDGFLRRVVAHMTMVPTDRIEDGTTSADEKARLAKAQSVLKGERGRGLFAVDMASPTWRQVEQAVQQAGNIRWAVVDSLSNMDGGGDEIYSQTSEVAEGLQVLSRQNRIPVFTTVQVGRAVENRPLLERIPNKNDAYGSGRVEQNSAYIFTPFNLWHYEDEMTEDEKTIYEAEFPRNTVRLYARKNRYRALPNPRFQTVKFIGGCGVYEYKSVNINEVAQKALDKPYVPASPKAVG
jgi:replicative DNA helicase